MGEGQGEYVRDTFFSEDKKASGFKKVVHCGKARGKNSIYTMLIQGTKR